MALTRKFLEGLGIDADKVPSIIEAHAETVDGLKTQIDQLKGDSTKLASVQAELDAANKRIADLDDDGFKAKYEAEHKSFEDYKKAQTEREAKSAKETAYKALLKDAGILEKAIPNIVKITDMAAIELDENGSIKDSENIAKKAAEDWSGFVVQHETEGAEVPKPSATVSGNITSKADIFKKDEHGRYLLSASERMKAIAENANLF